MPLQIGSQEHIRCIQHLDSPGPHGEELCLGYKYTYHVVGLPAYVSDDGYVLQINDSDRYTPLDASLIADGQRIGALPKTLPPYSLSAGTYVWGYSLWPTLVLIALLMLWGARRKAAKLKRRIAADAATPVATGGPVLRTEGDRYIQAQVAPQLHAGETITHQGYGLNRPLAGGRGVGLFVSAARQKGVFAAWTGARLFLIETRVGAFKPLYENKGVEVIERARIRAVTRPDEHTLVIELDDGTTRAIVVDDRKKKYFSNQDELLRDLPRITPSATAA